MAASPNINLEDHAKNCTVVFGIDGFSEELEYKISPFEAAKLKGELEHSRGDSSKLAFFFRFRDVRRSVIHVDLRAVNYVRFWGFKRPDEGVQDANAEPEFDEASYATEEGHKAFYAELASNAWCLSLYLKGQQKPMILEFVNGINFDDIESLALAELDPEGYFEICDSDSGSQVCINLKKLVLLEAEEVL
jgi:hypothetical protein